MTAFSHASDLSRSRNLNFPKSLPTKFESGANQYFVQLKSQARFFDQLEFSPNEWILSYDLSGEVGGRVFVKLLKSPHLDELLQDAYAKDAMITTINNFLESYLTDLDERGDLMVTLGGHQEVGFNAIVPASLLLENSGWIKFQSRYMILTEKLNIAADFSFQMLKKDAPHV